ncbi:MAG: hypothetical protein ACLP59_23940 [Bryobacteraceae bacterium]
MRDASRRAIVGMYQIGIGGDDVIAVDGQPVDRNDSTGGRSACW